MMSFDHFNLFSTPRHKYGLLNEECPERIFLCIHKLFVLCPIFVCIRLTDCEKVANVMHYQLSVRNQNHILSPCDRYAKWLISAPHSM